MEIPAKNMTCIYAIMYHGLCIDSCPSVCNGVHMYDRSCVPYSGIPICPNCWVLYELFKCDYTRASASSVVFL